jgi:hypothetical protein
MTLILSGTDNSATTPAVTGGTAGTSTGVYYPATNQVAIATNGTQAMLVNASQNTTFAGTLTTAAQGIAKASLPAGSVLQVVSATLSASASTSNTSFVASTLIATITPTSATSKILILLNGGTRDSNQTSNSQQTAMYRNIASAGYSSLSNMEGLFYNSANPAGGHTFNYLDSPSTTSSISYQPYFKQTNGGTVWFNSGGVVSLTLMEIAA